ncbi:unnamed protein product, partial [Owenia fusiformis]
DSSAIGSDIYKLREGFSSNRQPVYKGSNGLYLFSMCLIGQQYWYISDTFPPDPDAYHVRTETIENLPVDIVTSWSTPVGSIVEVDIQPYLYETKPCDTIFVSGLSNLEFLGLFDFSNQFSNGRPVYRHEYNNGYIYHKSDHWYIGENIDSVSGIFSVASLAGTPYDITETWDGMVNIEITCQEATATCTSISLTGVRKSTIDTKYAGLYEAIGTINNRGSYKHKTKDFYVYYVPIEHWILA